MDFLREAVQLIFLLLLFYIPGDCYSIKCAGELTVDKDIIPMGSNLTVRCQSNTVQCNRPFIIQLDEQIILHEISCSNVTARLVVREPEFTLYCMVVQEGKRHLVCARNIVAEGMLPLSITSLVTVTTLRIKVLKKHRRTTLDFLKNIYMDDSLKNLLTKNVKEPPLIAFAKGSLSPTIHWQSSDNMTLLKPRVRFRKTDGLHRGEVLMPDDLEPLTSYEFELRVCTASLMHNCSLWSQLISQKSPGQAPSSKLDVWRVIMRHNGSDTQNVTVLWKAFTPEDYKGDLLGYELVYKENGVTHTLSCSVAASQYTLQLPLEVTEVNVSAVTSAGSSPPAPVRLIYTGKPAPTIYLSQAAGGRIHLNWNSSLPSYSNTPDQTLGFVVEWKCSSIEMQWKRIANDQKSTMLYHSQFSLLFATMYFSLYVESTEGVSDPAFGQIHVKDENVMLIGISLMTAIPIIIILNLLYLKCARQRLRKTCMSVGPSWLFENLPKLGNSNAIKLLYWPKPVDSDPPLSPVEDFSPPVEIKDVYPIVHKDDTTEERKAAQDWASCPYKPQISIVSQRIEAVSEVAESEEDENPWLVFSPGFNKFDDEFLPSQEIHGPLKSCLTVDGTPISVDVVDGLIVLTRATLEEEIWRAEGDGAFEAETGNCDENSHKGQTVLPSDLVNCLKDPSFSVRPHSPQRASTFITSSGVKPCFILSINFCEML
uniref:Interleukin 23 receptor n=1 Tax=Pygocentrus nattereri TaxID=42514 RepID=A0A3B4DRY7_PYGNA